MTYRVVESGPGFTVVEPTDDHDPHARYRPVLDRLSPRDREAALIELALYGYNRKAKARIVARYKALADGEGGTYTEAAFTLKEQLS